MFNYSDQNDPITAGNGLLRTGPCVLTTVVIGTDGTNDAYLRLFDNLTTSTTKIAPTLKVNGADNYGGIVYSATRPPRVNTGLFYVLSGTGANANIHTSHI